MQRIGSECPRCGYDQTGEVAAWRGVCPLGGRCPECGLDFWWGDVLNPRRTIPAWSFEHAYDRWLRKLGQTLWVTLRPRRLWNGLRLHHEIRWGRLGLLLVAGWIGGAVAVPALIAAGRFIEGVRAGGTLAGVAGPTLREAAEFMWEPYSGASGYRMAVNPWVLHVALSWLILPLMFFLLPTTLRRARVRPGHIARIEMYSLVTVTALIASRMLLGFFAGVLWSTSSRAPRFNSVLQWLWRPDRPFLTVVWLGWIWVFWWWAGRSYLRIPNAGAVALAMALVACLAAGAILVLIPGFALRWTADL